MNMKTNLTSALLRFKTRLLVWALPAALSVSMAQAQTILLNPADSGGFESGTGSLSDNGWTGVGNASNDTWYTGNPGITNSYNPPLVGTRHAYIGATAGTWGYGAGSGNFAAHMYKDITVPAGQTQVILSFKYQIKGGTNNKLFVYVCPNNAVPVLSQPSGNGGAVTNDGWGAGTGVPLLLFASATPNTSTGPLTYSMAIPTSFLNNCNNSRTFRIVFTSWRNNAGSATNNPSGAVDDIKITSQVPVSPAPSTFTINNTLPTSGTNFNNFTDAINWLNAVSTCGLSNPITFNVSAGQTFNENTPYITASGTASNQIVFQKSGAGANPVIRPTGEFGANMPTTSNPGQHDYGICLHGADYVTFDGIDITSNNFAPATAATSVAVEYGYLIRSASNGNGANNNTIKNTTIILDRTAWLFNGSAPGSRGIVQSANGTAGGAVSATNQNGTNSNNSYYNFTIGNVNQGMLIYGAFQTLPDQNTKIGTLAPGTFNIIGRPGVPNDIGNAATATFGINMHFQYNAIVTNNKIQNLTTTGAFTVDGIVIGSPSGSFNGSAGFNNEVANNQISALKSTSTSSTATLTGIRIQHESTGALGATGFKIYNNVVSNITSGYTGAPSATRVIKGLWLSAPSATAATTNQYEIVNNTIVVDGSNSPNLSNTVFENNYPASLLKLRNNLFYNTTGAQSGIATHSIIGIVGATSQIGTTGSLSNYNDFYFSNPSGGLISFNNGITSLSAWQSTFGVDANSMQVDPKLNNANVLYPILSSPLIGAGPTLSAPYNRDIMGNLRASGNSTIGAYEQTGDLVAPLISDTLIMGNSSTANRVLPGLLNVLDDGGMVANTPGTAPRLYFKKSTDANAFGANNSTFNGWKYVEASNTTSPFDFTINYALLTAPVVAHDVIQYFFVAQDTVSTPNVAALPSNGFAGTSVGTITAAPAVPKSYVIYNAPALYLSSTATQASTSSLLQNGNNNAILRVALQTGPTGDSAYVTSMTFNSSFPTDMATISAAKVWYTGTNSNFDAYNTSNKQFGNTYTIASGAGALGAFTVTGAQITPPNSTVYFWLTFDIRPTAVQGDSVDASITAITYDGLAQTPVVPNPNGSRKVKPAYCIPAPTGNRHIQLVTFNTLNNNVGSTPFSSPNLYVAYAPTGTNTTTLKRGSTYNLSLTQSTASTSIVAYIDYNDNSVFDANETINVSVTAGAAGTVTTVPVTIPCDAVLSSETRMRIISYLTGSPWTGPCATINSNGEVQDYTLTIADNPVDYVSSTATQFSGSVAPGTTNKMMMRLPIRAQGCGTGFLTDVYCNVAKTMNSGSNIVAAKLYSTGKSNVFTTSKLLASVPSPLGSFTFTGFSDSLYTNLNDTNYYWIVYDMSASATLNDTIDVRIDSIAATGRYVIPVNNNPAQYLLVKSTNTYSNSDVIHAASARIPRAGQAYSPVLRVRIVGTATGAPVQLTQLNFDPSGGGNDTLNIASARVFYTGNNSTFSAVNPFGNTYTAGTNITGNKWNTFSISGVQDLNFDTNYFWLAYDITANAALNDSVDADLLSFNIGAAPLSPTTKNVTGALPIKANYCFMGPSGGSFSSIQPADWYEEITNVTFGSINNSSTCAQTGGVGSVLGQYSDYSDIVAPANVLVGDTVRFTLTGVGNCNQASANTQNMGFVVMIDWNQNGTFEATEVAYRSAVSTSVRTYTDKLFVPCSALPGLTRMRIIYGTGSNAANAALLGTICGNTSTSIYLFGETEDYTINVQTNPVSTIKTSFVQSTADVGVGVTDAPVLRIAVKPKGCGALLNAMHFSVTGTALADITSAKLYTTGTSNTFNTNTLLGSTAPASNIQFTGLTSAFTNNNLTDSTYFWLTFDVSSSATLNNLLDGKLDSLVIGGIVYNTLSTGNPAGNRKIVARMAYAGTTVTQPDTASVAVGTFNKQILRINVTGNNTNGPVSISSLSFNVNGSGNNLLNVDSARVYYTGTSTTFSTATPFGTAYSAAPGAWGAFTITGNVSTSTTNNYFWLVYDIKPTATILDSVDAELTSVTFDGVPQAYTLGATQGNSKIRGNYCQTTHQGSNSVYYILTSVTVGGVTTSTTSRIVPFYIDNTGTAVRNLQKGPNSMSVTINDLASGGNVGGYTYVYIDYDQNGDFTGPNELVVSVPTPLMPSNPTGVTAFNYFIPCDVKTGITRMRITTSHSSTPPALCGLSAFHGETEDYTVNIQASPLTYSMSAATQSSGSVIQGGNNQLIMNLKVRSTGCGAPLLTNLYFNTAGSTNPAGDILAAKLYKTGKSNVFSTATLLGTVSSPNGAFNFASSAINDTLVSGNDTSYYWLTYDISPTATNNDTVDVRVDSIIVMGSQRIPSNNNPVQFKKVLAPMSILDISASHPSGDRVGQASNNFQALCVRVIASSSGATLPVTALNFNTNGGGNDVNNLTEARVYYTGNNKNFATTTQFGTTYTPGSNIAGNDWLPFAITGYQELAPDTNYFWLTFNIKATAVVGDSVDAEAASMIIHGVTQTVSNSAPSGSTVIRQEYCFPLGGSAANCIDTARIGTLTNATPGQCAIYTNYPKSATMTASAYAGSSLPISLVFSAPTRASVFIDLNRNGVFELNEEYNIAPTYVASISTSIVIPANAQLGDTRLRLRTFWGGPTGVADRPCANWNQSEIEDYTITILPALPQTTYTWNNAGTSDFTLPSNWIPARTGVSATDVLVFNAPGSTLNITNMFMQTVASVEVTTRTNIHFNASSPATLKVTGTLTLNDSSTINGNNNMMIEIGESVGNAGSLSVGNASGINTKMKRWVNASNSTNLVFPFYVAKGSRSLSINYTFAPIVNGSLVASFTPTKALGNFGFPLYEAAIASDITKTSAEGYWNIEAADGLSGGVYYGGFTMDSVMGVTNPYSLTVINRADAFNPWVLNGSHSASTITGATLSVYRSTMQGYGQFTIASDSNQNALPVTLTALTAKAEGSNVVTKWTTGSELNNLGFDLERSVDGKSFEAVTFVKGAGTSSVTHHYGYNDANAFAQANVLYYRLKQVDMDGKFTYSQVVKVSSNMQKASTVNVFPNPFTTAYSVTLDVQNDATVTMTMTDIQGRTVASETTFAHKGNNTLTLNNIAALQAGVYFLKVNVDGENQVIKLIKN